VFCAGEGTRLRPLTLDRPKPLLDVAGRPILEYILEWLRAQGIREVAINLHYRADAVVQALGDGARLGLRIVYSHEPELLGSAGALRQLAPFLAPAGSQRPFAAVYGDVLTTLPLAPLLALHERVEPTMTMAVMDHPRPTEAGIVEFVGRETWHGGEAGRVTRIVEKPTPEQVFSTLANAGVFVFSPSVVDLVPASGPADIARDLIPAVLAAGRALAAWRVPPESVIWDVGTIDSYRRAQTTWPQVWAARPQ
jgi:NDP-sugar pyrophosphorylase family protein